MNTQSTVSFSMNTYLLSQVQRETSEIQVQQAPMESQVIYYIILFSLSDTLLQNDSSFCES